MSICRNDRPSDRPSIRPSIQPSVRPSVHNPVFFLKAKMNKNELKKLQNAQGRIVAPPGTCFNNDHDGDGDGDDDDVVVIVAFPPSSPSSPPLFPGSRYDDNKFERASTPRASSLFFSHPVLTLSSASRLSLNFPVLFSPLTHAEFDPN